MWTGSTGMNSSERLAGLGCAGLRLHRLAQSRPAWAAILAVALLVSSIGIREAIAQMASTAATDRPGLPLPRGMKAPVADFRDLAGDAGLKAVIVSGEFKQTYLVEGTGTGVALFDYDNDDLLDIFLVNADHLAPLSPPPTVHLYHNLGGLRFEDVTAKAG